MNQEERIAKLEKEVADLKELVSAAKTTSIEELAHAILFYQKYRNIDTTDDFR